MLSALLLHCAILDASLLSLVNAVGLECIALQNISSSVVHSSSASLLQVSKGSLLNVSGVLVNAAVEGGSYRMAASFSGIFMVGIVLLLMCCGFFTIFSFEKDKPPEERGSPALMRDSSIATGFHRTSETVPTFLDSAYNSWKLLFSIMGALVRFWGVLAIMSFALVQDGANSNLMDCEEASLDNPVRHACKYTKAFLHAYPFVCVNMTLVLMVRVLVQMQLYYSMLKRRRCVDFESVEILKTPWPWVCAFSMVQGELHFALKTYMDTREVNLHFIVTVLTASYKFIIPGIMFLTFFPNYTQVENMLVPLNRIMEQDTDITRNNRTSPYLAQLEVVHERVLAKYVRGDEYAKKFDDNASLTVDDVIKDLIDSYENAYKTWTNKDHTSTVHQSKWVFKAMWPAAVLFHKKMTMDWKDRETRQWVIVLGIVLAGSVLASAVSLFFLVALCDPSASILSYKFLHDLYYGDWAKLRTDTIISNLVLCWHALVVGFFVYRTVCGMFASRFGERASDAVAVGIILAILIIVGLIAQALV